MADLETEISDNASGPKRVQGDEATVEQHSLKDQIEADRYLATKRTNTNKRLGIRMFKTRPPGSSEIA